MRTLGCRLNHAESDALQYDLEQQGYQVVAADLPADLTVINSCVVTQQAEAKTRAAIAAARRISSHGKIVLLGCIAELGSAQALTAKYKLDLVLGNSDKYDLCQYLPLLEKDASLVKVTEDPYSYSFPRNGTMASGALTRANLKVQDGCDYFCTYCIVPFLRGRARSRKLSDCIHEARNLEQAGYREVVLTGVNLGTYQSETGEDLVDLLDALLANTKGLQFRLSSIEPNLVTEHLIQKMREEERLCRYLHIPLQHAADEILRKMNRKYDFAFFAKLVKKLEANIPAVCIGTDILVGYPGETENHFLEMQQRLAELPLTYFHVFRYSPRPGTASYPLKDSVAAVVKKERSRQLRNLSRSKRAGFLRRFIDQDLKVLFEEQISTEQLKGHTHNYIDVRVKGPATLVNQFHQVHISALKNAYLEGELIRV